MQCIIAAFFHVSLETEYNAVLVINYTILRGWSSLSVRTIVPKRFGDWGLMQVSISSIIIPPGTDPPDTTWRKHKPSPRDNHCVQKPSPRDKTGSQKPHPRDIKLENFMNVFINSDTIWNEKLCGLNKWNDFSMRRLIITAYIFWQSPESNYWTYKSDIIPVFIQTDFLEDSQHQMPDNQTVSYSQSFCHQENDFNFLALFQSRIEQFSLRMYKISEQQVNPKVLSVASLVIIMKISKTGKHRIWQMPAPHRAAQQILGPRATAWMQKPQGGDKFLVQIPGDARGG